MAGGSGSAGTDDRVRRVAIVSDWCLPRRGGIEAHILDLAKNLRREGVEATILTSFPGPAEIDGVAVERVRTLLLPGAGIAISPMLVGAVESRLQAGGHDLVHLHSSQVAPFCLAAALAADRLGVPVAATFHSTMTVLAPMLALAGKWTGRPRRPVAMSGVSTLVARQITDAMPSRQVEVLPNGYDASFWGGTSRPPRLADAPLRLVSAMRLQRRKRPFALLDIFARALGIAGRAGQGATLAIAGDGPLRADLLRRAERLGFAGRVEFKGWLERRELRELYNASDLFVMPSVKESFCIAALEARAAGLPVVGMAATGMSDFIREGRNGELAAGDEDMAARIAELMGDRARLARLAADDGGLARFAWDRLAEAHADFYGRVAARHSGST